MPNKTVKKSSDGNRKQAETIHPKQKLNTAAILGFDASKTKTVHFKVIIKCTHEQFNVNSFPLNMKIRDLKGLLELITGIPYNLQRLSYLDDGELIDPREIQYYDVIDGAILMMDIWSIYLNLIRAAALGDFKDVLKQGVSQSEEWSSAASEYMFKLDKVKYIQERSGIALFVASHRGNINMVRSLIAIGAQINYKSSFGRTPIMISIASDKMQVVDLLLEAKVDIDVEDLNGDTVVDLAKKYNNKLGQHRLAQFKWKKRTEEELKNKKNAKKNEEIPVFNETRLPHQVFDSSKKTWFKGNFMQVYMAHLVPPDEYSGTKLGAPKSIGIAVLQQHRLTKSNTDLNMLREQETNSDLSMPIQKGLTFDMWLAHKLRLKRLELKKKKDEAKLEIIESDVDLFKEVMADNEPDRNTWMKDYSKQNQNRSTEANQLMKTSMSNKNNDDIFSFSRATNHSAMPNRLKVEVTNIYKGMPYEEWQKIYDEFVSKKLEC